MAEWRFEKHELVAEVTQSHNNEKTYYHLDLTGIYQVKNLVTVLEAIRILQEKKFNLTDAQVQKGLRQVKKLTGLHGRWETIHDSPKIVLMAITKRACSRFPVKLRSPITKNCILSWNGKG